MNIKKGFIIVAGISMLFVLIISAGIRNFSARAAEESLTRLESFTTEQEILVPAYAPDADGKRAYWLFNDGPAATLFADEVENPVFNNGACVDLKCPTSTTSGKMGSAFIFDGNDEIKVADTSGLEFTIGGDMSIETWVKIEITQDCSTRVVFVGQYEAPGKAAWWLGCVENNFAAFHMRDSENKEFTVSSTSTINDGEWHHIVGTRDGATNVNKIYVDGRLENSGTPAFTGELMFTDKDVTIGYFAPHPYYWLNGTLDEMALHDQVLYSQEGAANIFLPILLKNH